MTVRINKYLSMCGVSSRRGAEKLIQSGKVTVNDQTVSELGTVIDDLTDVVKVDGTEVRPVSTKLYVLLNKPRRVMTTLHDPFRRRTVRHLTAEVPERVYPVGRLDYDAEGLLLLTNDGDLAFRLAHPRYQVPKLYRVTVQGKFGPRAVEMIEKGIKLEDGAIGHGKVGRVEQRKKTSVVHMILTEGRKREVKQLCLAVGHRVDRLQRIRFAQIELGSLASGKWRFLTSDEIHGLKRLVGLA